MEKSSTAEYFKNIFQNYLRINVRTISVKTLLSERNLKRINYSPYYQRNYVWDNVKQTFFIESVILGTEIPPLILFKTGNKIEVIDGRQRFETLKKFKENDFSLTVNGLKELQSLSKDSFNKLSETNKEIFLNSNIRVFEFEVINQPNITEDIVDRVKKEIFRRYNTGITPLTKEELDNAKYTNDAFSDLFKAQLKRDFDFFKGFNFTFFPKEPISQNENNEGLIAQNVDFMRRFRILNSFPITTYASGSDRTEIIELLYDFANNNSDDPEKEFEIFKSQLLCVIDLSNKLNGLGLVQNKLIFECILWGLTILERENITLQIDPRTFLAHYSSNLAHYSDDSSFYYKSIITRYTDTASFLTRLTNFDFSLYIKDEEFRARIGKLKQTEIDASESIAELSNLRLHKPNPISTPVDEIRNDIKTTRYLVRPSYQRQEKINQLKASSIIESILLGINLPPIFIFRRKSGIKEVVDGQQRLLAIIGFLGEQYNNENGKLTYSKNNSFKLKNLKVLTELEGDSFSSLPSEFQDKIVDFILDLIIIEESVNENFDPIDLFIRLNYKPYPIKSNSFEMWNSIVNHVVINRIKSVTAKHKNWFFLREIIEGKPDRMQNEEMITILSYIIYNNQKSINDGVIGFFPRQDRITCRLKDKKGLGDFLTNLEINAVDKEKFIEAIEKTDKLIGQLGLMFNNILNKETLNDFLNIKQATNFKRSLQDFYVMWLILGKIPANRMDEKGKILMDIRALLAKLRNVNSQIVDSQYSSDFFNNLELIIAYYN